MKDMVESAPSVDDSEGEHRSSKVAVDGGNVAAQQNGGDSPGASSTSSRGELHLHLSTDSDEEKERRDGGKSVVESENSHDLENIHDPNPIKLTTKSSGANVINKYKDSAVNDSVGTDDSANKKVDSNLMESKNGLKSNDLLDLADSNNCDIKDANDRDENSGVDVSKHVNNPNISLVKNLNKTVSDSSADRVKETISMGIATTCPAKSDVPLIIKKASVSNCTDTVVKKETLNSSNCTDTVVKKETLNSKSNETKKPVFTSGNSNSSISNNSLIESKPTLSNVTDELLEANDTDSGKELCINDKELTAKNVSSTESDLKHNDNPNKLSVSRKSDATKLSFDEDCNDNDLLTVDNGDSKSCEETGSKDSNTACDRTDLESTSEERTVLREDTEVLSSTIKVKKEEMMVENVTSIGSNLPQEKKTSSEKGKTQSNDIEPGFLLEDEEFELKLELECSDDSQDIKSDVCLKSDKSVASDSCNMEGPEQLATNAGDENPSSGMVHKGPTDVLEHDMLKVHDSENLNDGPNKTKEINDEPEAEESSLHAFNSNEAEELSVETRPDMEMDNKEETLVKSDCVVSDSQNPLSPAASSDDADTVTPTEKGEQNKNISVGGTEHDVPNVKLIYVKRMEDLCIQHKVSDAASDLKMIVNEDNVANKKHKNSSKNDVSDLKIDLSETNVTPKPKIDEDTDGGTMTTCESVEQTLEQSDLLASNSSNLGDHIIANKDDTESLSEKSNNEVHDIDAVKLQAVDSCSANKSDSASECKETSNINEGDSVPDKLLSNEVQETADKSACIARKSTAPSDTCSESDMKENDAPITDDVDGMSAASTDVEDGSRDSVVSSEKDDSRGFTEIGRKRSPTIDSPVECKRPKFIDNQVTVSAKEVNSQSPSLKRSSELNEISTSKKSRVDSAQVPSTKSNEGKSKELEVSSSTENGGVSSQSRKSLSNIDKAIERVAFAGLDRKERVMMPFIKDLKNKRLQEITVDDLEELVTQRMAEVLSDSGENGVLREKVQKLERMCEFWKHKSSSLQKQLSDMTMVFKKLATETKQNSSQLQIPIKITRSVGLQVMMPLTQSGGKSNTHVRNGLPPGAKRKSGGIMTNRNTTPNVQYSSSNTVTQNRPPVVQKVIAPPVATSTPAKVSQAVSATKSPATGTLTSTVRFRSPNTVVSSVVPPTVTTAASNQRTVPSVANRPLVKTSTLRPASDMLIDLTDEDDKTKRVATSTTTALPTLRLAQFNGTPQGQSSTIRIVSPQQLTNTTTGVNGPRLAYMLPASAANAATGRLQLFTQQPGGNLRTGSLLTVRPSSQTLTLKNGTVLSSGTPTSAIIRTTSGGTFQQVVSRAPQMRSIQPASRLATSQFSRTSSVLAEPPVSRPLVTVPSGHSQHPAPLPPSPPEVPSSPNWKKAPPRPDLKISKVDTRDQHGIILSWNMDHGPEHEEIASYQLYAYQENSGPPLTSLWKKVGDVKAMPLPMACTLTQFLEGNKYHFAVRAVDIHSRCGMFSIPGHIILPRRVTS